MVAVAQIGYAQAASFPLNAPRQPSLEDRIEYAMRNNTLLQQAAKEEGLEEWLDDDLRAKSRL
jgi:hypothetical protein